MELVFTTREFRVGGIEVEGFPLLVTAGGHFVRPLLHFSVWYLLHRGSVASRATWRNYGYCLLQYFRFLEESQRSWDEPPCAGQPSVLASYRTWAHTRKANSIDTINQRLDLICKFYQFAYHRGYVTELPFEFEFRQGGFNEKHHRQPMLGGKAQGQLVADVKFRKVRKIITALTLDQSRALLEHLSDRTHRLIAKLQIGTGLRVGEVVSFPVELVCDPGTHPSTALFPVRLVPKQINVKGGVERVIHVPRYLMEDLWIYLGTYRKGRADLSNANYPELFLTPDGSPYSTNAVWKFIRAAATKAGFHASPHTLRHTYATHTLATLMKSRNVGNALLYVADRLGHASINTTRVYLHWLGGGTIEYMDAYQSELDTVLASCA